MTAKPDHARFESALTLNTLSLSREERVMTVTLNRPQQMNTVTEEMAAELRRIAGRMEDDAAIRVVVIRGAGDAFSAGGDVNLLFKANLADPKRVVRQTLPDFHEFILALRRMDKVVIGAVHGVAAGGGLSLAIACDYVLAASNAKFAWAYRNLATTPDGGGSYFLTRNAGEKRAFDLLLHRKTFSAAEAREFGLVTEIAEPGQWESALASLAQEFSTLPATVVVQSKRLIYSAAKNTLAEHLAQETESFSLCAGTPDFIEGVNAFLEKRKPKFN